MMTTGTFARSGHGTHMLCSNGFGRSASSGMNCQWYRTLEEIDLNTKRYWLLLLYKWHDLSDTCILLFSCTCYYSWYFIRYHITCI